MKQILSLLILFVSVATTHAHAPSKAYIYDSVNDSRTIVLNLTNSMLTFQDKSSVRIDEITEFGGSLQACGDEEYFCLTGSIDIVIPKVLSSMTWTYHDVSCVAKLISKDSRVYKIVCYGPGRDIGTEVEYSYSRGVVSVMDGTPSDQTRFELRGEYGLFSSSPGEKGVRDNCGENEVSLTSRSASHPPTRRIQTHARVARLAAGAINPATPSAPAMPPPGRE